MGVLQKSLGKKDAEINAGKHEIQLSSLEMGCYTFIIAFPLGILLTQTFHFHPVIEDGTSHNPIHVSNPQKLLFIVN